MASADLRQELVCSVCLSIYTDPVTLRCGHNFCRGCIACALDAQEGSRAYSCPECRAEFQKRPALIRNITLCNIVGSFLSTLKDHEETGIFCCYCIHSPVPAAKSCLMCEAHLCDNHLRVHSKLADHVLSDLTTDLGNRKCSIHKKVLEYYCTEDDVCVCVSCCLIGEHREHQVESLDDASEKRKQKLRDVLQKLSTKRAAAEKRVQSLLERRRDNQEKAAGIAERVTTLFSDIRRQLEDLEKRVLSEIFRQEERVSLSVSDLIQQLEIKKEELSRKMRHIEELCNMSDPVTVLQEPDTVDILCDTKGRKRPYTHVHDGGDLNVGPISETLHTLSDIITGINTGIYGQEATDPLLDVVKAENTDSDITDTNTGIFVQEPVDIFLDVTTAGNNIFISGDGKTASVTRARFQYQVISTRGFTSGRNCWDAEICNISYWRVGMCYPSIDRKGRQSHIGENHKSWCVRGHNNKYTVMHDDIDIRLPELTLCERVRIVVDYDAGQLSFYSVDFYSTRHLHTFNTTFTEPIHAALWLRKGNIIISGVKSGAETDADV
ncbi:E3 ubiquitin/ISG15 ligase TRIM25-like [Pseudophryne corroboree]|uniref:E3 ubiquitin/ISG15 ligase TRIM25-like n=1 Tax=Pseudophryne corroboree TaxID=495146 RepID=UPI003081AC7F